MDFAVSKISARFSSRVKWGCLDLHRLGTGLGFFIEKKAPIKGAGPWAGTSRGEDAHGRFIAMASMESQT